jgi:hypothetical protein
MNLSIAHEVSPKGRIRAVDANLKPGGCGKVSPLGFD